MVFKSLLDIGGNWDGTVGSAHRTSSALLGFYPGRLGPSSPEGNSISAAVCEEPLLTVKGKMPSLWLYSCRPWQTFIFPRVQHLFFSYRPCLCSRSAGWRALWLNSTASCLLYRRCDLHGAGSRQSCPCTLTNTSEYEHFAITLGKPTYWEDTLLCVEMLQSSPSSRNQGQYPCITITFHWNYNSSMYSFYYRGWHHNLDYICVLFVLFFSTSFKNFTYGI